MQEHREITKKNPKPCMPNKVRLHQYGQQVTSVIKLQIVGFASFPSFIATVVFNPTSTRVVGTHDHLYILRGKKPQ